MRILVATLTAGLSALATVPGAAQQPVVPAGKSMVVVYRPALGHSGPDSTRDTPVVVDGVTVVALKTAGRYCEVLVDPGVHSFYSESPDDAFALRLEPGQTSFLRLETRAGFIKAHGVLAPLDPEFGAQDYATKSTTSLKVMRVKLKQQKLDRQPPASVATADSAEDPPEQPSTLLTAPPHKALLVFDRPRGVHPLVNTSVFVDGRELADLDDGTYAAFAVEPGNHQLRSDEEQDTFSLDLAAGDVRYVRLDTKSGVWKGHGEMVAFESAWGRRDFAKHLTADGKAPAIKPARDVRAPEMAVAIPTS